MNFQVATLDGVARILIDRPEKHNAMTVEMWRTLAEICAELGADRGLRAVVISGAGASFCAGADISALSEADATMKAVVAAAEQALRALPMLTIAVVRGACMGGGTQIAIACDLRLADDTARFAVPPARLGVVYPAASLRGLVALVGPAAAKRLLFTAGTVEAGEALRLGLIDQLFAPAELDRAVEELLNAARPLSALSQLAAKAVIDELVDGGDAEAVQAQWERQWQASADGVEGPRAFLERRAPVFTWRRP